MSKYKCSMAQPIKSWSEHQVENHLETRKAKKQRESVDILINRKRVRENHDGGLQDILCTYVGIVLSVPEEKDTTLHENGMCSGTPRYE